MELFFFILVIVLAVLLITTRQSRHYAAQTRMRLCRLCGLSHPSFASYCRRCGEKL